MRINTPSVSNEDGSALTATFTGDTDGSNNWNYITTIEPVGSLDPETYYPAFNYALNYGTTTVNLSGSYASNWYIPSLAELCYICRNRHLLDTVLSAINEVTPGAATLLWTEAYWSSSQKDIESGKAAWFISFGADNINSMTKTMNSQICCIHKIN